MSAAKDVHRLIKNIGSLTDGQASVEGVDWDDGNVQTFIFVLRPKSDYFKGGRFEFKVYLDEQYPSTTAPTVHCLTDIFHPNIVTCDDIDENSPSNVCLNLFDTGTWNPSFGLETIALGLLFLLNNPNMESPLNNEFFESYESERFEEDVKRYMRGEEVDGTYFDVQFYSNVNGSSELLEERKSCDTKIDTSCVSSCDVEAMNMMCDDTNNVDTSANQQNNNFQKSSILNSFDSQSNNPTADSIVAMKLVSVDSDVVLLNDFCRESHDRNDQPECEMDTTEMETASDVINTVNTCFKDNFTGFSSRSNLVKHSSFYPHTGVSNCNGQLNIYKLTRTITA